MTTVKPATKWKCMLCKAPQNNHGLGPCRSEDSDTCEGLLCYCSEAHRTAKDHGESLDHECVDARCDHCGWKGAMPNLRLLRAGLN